MSIRPEAMRLETGDGPRLQGTVHNRIFLGSTAEYAIEIRDVGTILVAADHLAHGPGLKGPGDSVSVGFAPGAPLAFAA